MSTNTPKFRSLLDVTKRFPDEQACRDYLLKARWGNKVECTHCHSSEKIYKFQSGKLLKCGACHKQFTVKVGTIFEDSALPLQKWFMAIYLITAHKKGISSLQLHRDIGVTQKTAWFMLHRIRYAIRTDSVNRSPLSGTIEADETYIGGKHKGFVGRTTAKKAVVMGIVQRGGRVIAQQVTKASAAQLQPIIRRNTKKGSTVVTDDWGAYNGLSHTFNHQVINHSKKEYVRGDVHTNTVEGFLALLKRGIHGIYHHVSKKHLDKYVDEFEFRWNSRKAKDPVRFSFMLNDCEGRLMYRTLIHK